MSLTKCGINISSASPSIKITFLANKISVRIASRKRSILFIIAISRPADGEQE
jgi:hypothetical protein